ncbi:MAG: NAD(P)H-dependent glycerol-3-phosphate dehydrogenase [Deltaproteobacteria bacterium]|nr:NAD(P)H-dependent glycerol-3-phosphate dehydrogenase [Deltaproteobacteria bacterium]MCX7952070.1 NAD(P)H-dependent glycerol-3-phosphate dehydrogenase [Deltaproteobacteria bacterium]
MRIGIVGGGSFGTALLSVYSAFYHCVVWDRDTELLDTLKTQKSNPKYLVNIVIRDEFEIAYKIGELGEANIIFVAIPSQNLDEVGLDLLPKDVPLILTCKGFTREGWLTFEYLKSLGFLNVLALSGPNFAQDLGLRSPCASILSGTDLETVFPIAKMLSNKFFRLYPSDDIKGVQLCGSLKNVYSIATGYAYGVGFGASSIFSILSRAVSELARILRAFNCKEHTAFGLAGIGDLFMTGSSVQSRNFLFGKLLAENYSPEKALKAVAQTVEGYNSAFFAESKILSRGLDLPLLEAVVEIVKGKFSKERIAGLLERPVKTEFP